MPTRERNGADRVLRQLTPVVLTTIALVSAGWATLRWASDIAGNVRDMRSDQIRETNDRCRVDRFLRNYLHEIEAEHHALFAALRISHPDTDFDLDDSAIAECPQAPRQHDIGG